MASWLAVRSYSDDMTADKSTEADATAFSRVDLLIVLGLLSVLGMMALVFYARWQAAARTALCGNHLRQLNTAMHDYARDHDNSLPPALVNVRGNPPSSWDSYIKDYLQSELLVKNSYAAERVHDRKVAPYFHCPSDTLERSNGASPRSYSMPRHNMERASWPPGSSNVTGVGLCWTITPPPATLEDGSINPNRRWAPPFQTNDVAWVKLSMIMAPQDTLLLTENIRPGNLLWKVPQAVIGTTAEQLAGDKSGGVHLGRFNYLMVDGHVETLTPASTVGHVGVEGNNAKKHYGIWTIRAND